MDVQLQLAPHLASWIDIASPSSAPPGFLSQELIVNQISLHEEFGLTLVAGQPTVRRPP
jgi:hypothetical protein